MDDSLEKQKWTSKEKGQYRQKLQKSRKKHLETNTEKME